MVYERDLATLTALEEQLGSTLAAEERLTGAIVIDHIEEKPADN